MIKVIDSNGRERNVISIKKIVMKIPDALHKGVYIDKAFVQLLIDGRSGRRWNEWVPWDQFKKNNPNIKVT